MAAATTDHLTNTAKRTTHAKLAAWVDEVSELTQPDSIHWCDGTDEEWSRQLVLVRFRSDRRSPRRGPHLHLQ